MRGGYTTLKTSTHLSMAIVEIAQKELLHSGFPKGYFLLDQTSKEEMCSFLPVMKRDLCFNTFKKYSMVGAMPASKLSRLIYVIVLGA